MCIILYLLLRANPPTTYVVRLVSDGLISHHNQYRLDFFLKKQQNSFVVAYSVPASEMFKK